MDLNNKDFWDMEKIKIKLQVFCSPVKRKRKYSYSLDLFSGSACESVDGITESPGNSNSISSMSSYPVEELKEQDLISCLMKSYRSSMYNTFCPDADCTLSLGMPHTLPTPDEQRCMDMFKKTSMEEVMEVMKSTLSPPKIKCSELESSPVLFGGLYNTSSSSWWSTATYAASSLNSICGSMLRDSKDIQAHTDNGTPLASEQGLNNKLNKASTNNFENNDIGARCAILLQMKQQDGVLHATPLLHHYGGAVLWTPGLYATHVESDTRNNRGTMHLPHLLQQRITIRLYNHHIQTPLHITMIRTVQLHV